MSDPLKESARQMDDWADRQKSEGFTGSVRMMGQTIGPAGNAVTPVYEYQIGDNPRHQGPLAIGSGLGPFLPWDLQQAALRWSECKLALEEAERNLINVAKHMRK